MIGRSSGSTIAVKVIALTTLSVARFHAAIAGDRPRDVQGSVILEVDQQGQRTGDTMPARVVIDAKQLFDDADALLDPSSIRVERIDDALPSNTFQVPARFDARSPMADSFFYQHIGGAANKGQVVFQHIAGNGPNARYRLSVNRWQGQASEAPASPAPQLGDADILRYQDGPLSGIFHTKLAIADWDYDGCDDVLAGDGIGRLTFYRRLGANPSRFAAPQLVRAGEEWLDTLWTCTPEIVDWDGDGDIDVICGEEERGGVILFENVGSRGRPQLAKGKSLADQAGKPIISPPSPVAEMSFYAKDYSPCPRAIDYNRDGKLDLVLGGYVSGQMRYYQNVRQMKGGSRNWWRAAPWQDETNKPIDVMVRYSRVW
jgi:hypothetical protein